MHFIHCCEVPCKFQGRLNCCRAPYAVCASESVWGCAGDHGSISRMQARRVGRKRTAFRHVQGSGGRRCILLWAAWPATLAHLGYCILKTICNRLRASLCAVFSWLSSRWCEMQHEGQFIRCCCRASSPQCFDSTFLRSSSEMCSRLPVGDTTLVNLVSMPTFTSLHGW